MNPSVLNTIARHAASGMAAACLLCAQGATATAAPPTATAANPTLAEHLRCEVAYMPARSTWVRHLLLTREGQGKGKKDDQNDGEGDRVLTLHIDGLVPHSFAQHGPALATAVDNERIQVNLQTLQWQSDFRGVATGQGRCEWDEPEPQPTQLP